MNIPKEAMDRAVEAARLKVLRDCYVDDLSDTQLNVIIAAAFSELFGEPVGHIINTRPGVTGASTTNDLQAGTKLYAIKEPTNG